MKTKRIVITGGPSTGKTVVIDALKERGYPCLEEVIRAMTLAKKAENDALVFESNPIVSVSDPQAFNKRILDARIAQFKTAEKATETCVFFDRGIPDVLAYMDCFGQTYDAAFETACIEHRYDLVFIMPPWEEIYTVDGERFESFEEALLVNASLSATYTRFGYDIEVVPKTTIAKRVDFILKRINELQ